MEGMKSYGWGIVDKDGLDCIVKFRSEEREKATEFVVWKDQEYPDNAPHRVVELFYKDDEAPVGEILTLVEMKAILYGDEQS